MKPQMQMGLPRFTSDQPVQDALMAKAKARHDRVSVIGQLANEGHITVLESREEFIRVRIEDEIFADDMGCFPSEYLIARLRMAIEAGRSERNRAWLSDEQTMAREEDKVFYTRLSEALEVGYRNVAKITGTVTK